MQLVTLRPGIPSKQPQTSDRQIVAGTSTSVRQENPESQQRFYKLEGPFIEYQNHHRRGLLAYEQQLSDQRPNTKIPHQIDEYV